MKALTTDWADGSHTFLLRVGEIEELQDKCGDVGPAVIFQRLQSGAWKAQDVRETIRLGLIGGGMAPAKALKMVQRYVDERPGMENVHPAAAIIGAWLFGLAEVQPDLSEGIEPDPEPEAPADASTSMS